MSARQAAKRLKAREVLQFAAVVDAVALRPWQAELIGVLRALNGSKPNLYRVDAQPGPSGLKARAWAVASAIDRRVSLKVHHRSFIKAGRHAEALRPVGTLDANIIDLRIRTDGPRADAPIDILVDLRGAGATSPIGIDPRLGTVRFLAGLVNPATGQADGAAEFLTASPLTEVELVFQPSDGTRPRLLSRRLRTFASSWSETVRRMEWRGFLFLKDVLEDLAKRGGDSRMMTAPPMRDAPTGGSAPSLVEIASAVPRMAWRTAQVLADRIAIHDQWRVMLTTRFERVEDIKDFASWQALIPPPDRMWADPFVKVVDGRIYIFVEEVEVAVGRGSIVCLKWADGKADRLGPVISEPFHLSYPFLLAHRGELYMLPESSEDNALHIYKCDAFPLRWSRVGTMLEGLSIADCTIFQHQGLWWLFGNVDRLKVGIHTSELHLFHAEDPLSGRWIAHELNPVIVDDRHARMAGSVIRIADKLVRFAQGSARYYGETLEAREILRLSPSEFEEVALAKAEPERRRGGVGVHHFTCDGTIGVVDACYKIPRLGWRGALAPLVRALS
jgi:hypothetical protein